MQTDREITRLMRNRRDDRQEKTAEDKMVGRVLASYRRNTEKDEKYLRVLSMLLTDEERAQQTARR